MRDKTECAQNGLCKGHDVPGKEKWEKDCLRLFCSMDHLGARFGTCYGKSDGSMMSSLELSKLHRSGTRVALR